MSRRKKKESVPPPAREPSRIAVAPPPSLPDVERAFFEMLLRELSGGLLEVEQLAKKPPRGDELPRKCAQARATASYGLALLRLEEVEREAGAPEELSSLLNITLNNMRRAFLYAGVAAHAPEDEALRGVLAPRAAALFLLEEMALCCLRCAPEGKNMHIGAKRIGPTLLLSMRTEGRALRQAPLIPLLTREEGPAADEDYGFAMCGAVAALLGWEFRWEADEAGVRMFLDIRCQA